jgi:hypothetical protein
MSLPRRLIDTLAKQSLLKKKQWEKPAEINELRVFEFPEHILMHELIDAYFYWFNVYTPIIHRSSFEADLASGLHLRDESFASVVLAICALGAVYVADNERNWAPGFGKTSSGWRWFNQIDLTRKSAYQMPRLYDMQMYCVRELRSFINFNQNSRQFLPP